MTEVIINPLNNGLGLWFYLGILLLALLFALVYAIKNGKLLNIPQNYQGLFMILLGFGILILSSTLLLSFIHSRNIKPLVFRQNAVEFANKQIQYSEIKNYYLKQTFSKSRYNSMINLDTVTLAVIEFGHGSTHVFSEENYSIIEIMETLKKSIPSTSQ